MDFRLRRQSLLERAKHVEKEASRQKNAQAQDIMRALAALYREMANELEEGSGTPELYALIRGYKAAGKWE